MTTEATHAPGRQASTQQILPARPELRRLLLSVAEGGKCAGAKDPDAWFDAPPFSHAHARQQAADLCHGCEVLEQCRTYALQAGEEFGVWGGLCEVDRAQLRQTRTARSREVLKRRGDRLLPLNEAG
jgi:WhiB family transcriptional regulator, redox-sensing transcriptional regulator